MDIQGYFTKKGLLLAAKLAAGSTLNITRVCTGAAETALSASALSQIRQTLSVGGARRNGETAVLPVTLEAGMAGSAYTLRELGVYAEDPDEGEILYKVYRLSEPVEISPASRLVLRFYLEETVSQDLNVTVVRASAGLLTEADLDPVRNKLELSSRSSRTVEVAGSELRAYLLGLPRLMTEALTVNVTGIVTDLIELNNFYGPGQIRLLGNDGCVFQNQLRLSGCNLWVGLSGLNLELPASSPLQGEGVVHAQGCPAVVMFGCKISANGKVGLWASYASKVYAGCGVKNCATAVLASQSSIVTVDGGAADYGGNTSGGYAWHGGVILLGPHTPDLLGGAANIKSGGTIAKANGMLL